MATIKKIVLHVITGLNDGGAEAALYRLCLHEKKFIHIVVSMMDEGKYGKLLQDEGVEVICLKMQQSRLQLASVVLLWKTIRKIRPDVIQTWMYHANLIGGIFGRLAGAKKIFWGIHHSNLTPGTVKNSTILIAKICGVLSHFLPTKIISCSRKSVEIHKIIGYNKRKFVVIPNGYDLNQFYPNSLARTQIRAKLGISDSRFLIGMIARFDPQKDHKNFLSALAEVKSGDESILCVLVGGEIDQGNSQLRDWIDQFGCKNNILLLGKRNDIPDIMNAIDVHVLSSLGEAFPNVLAEAMACSTPCITTDVGDAAFIVGNTGWVVTPQNPGQLAEAIKCSQRDKYQSEKWCSRKNSARQRIVDNFSIEEVAKLYCNAWLEIDAEPKHLK